MALIETHSGNFGDCNARVGKKTKFVNKGEGARFHHFSLNLKEYIHIYMHWKKNAHWI